MEIGGTNLTRPRRIIVCELAAEQVMRSNASREGVTKEEAKMIVAGNNTRKSRLAASINVDSGIHKREKKNIKTEGIGTKKRVAQLKEHEEAAVMMPNHNTYKVE